MHSSGQHLSTLISFCRHEPGSWSLSLWEDSVCPLTITYRTQDEKLIEWGLVEWIGYVGRAISSEQSPAWTLGPYLVQTLLLLVAPALFAASIYMELSRIIILADGEEHALIKKKWLTKLFVCGDVVSFLLQMGGEYSAKSRLLLMSIGLPLHSRGRHSSFRHTVCTYNRRPPRRRRSLRAARLLRLLHRRRSTL